MSKYTKELKLKVVQDFETLKSGTKFYPRSMMFLEPS
jgi:hypothetical protein